MSVIAAALRGMLDAGMDHDAIVSTVAAMEAAMPVALDPVAEKRRAWDRERKRKSGGNPVEPAETADTLSPETKVFPTPLSKTQPLSAPPKTPLKGVKKVPSRASKRCPAGWEPTPQTLAVLVAEGFEPGAIERALTRIRDHEFRNARSDWDAVLRNWVRDDADRHPRKAHDRPHPDAKFDARQDNLARAFRGADLAAGQQWKP